MKDLGRNIVVTADGSTTIGIPSWKEHYHSTHGAVNEAMHVFIQNGLSHWKSQNPNDVRCNILEIGFGTGLNAWLTFLNNVDSNLTVFYDGIEAFPVQIELIEALNYTHFAESSKANIFRSMHLNEWSVPLSLSPNFTLTKIQSTFEALKAKDVYDLIYYDAFGARVQPELWTVEMFQKMQNALKPGGVLVTYCAKGSVRRAMLDVGLEVERLIGPPGKREMLRASKKK
jgi:tRNA U34 5-methylaminomethyl-2-thiouridine-forming methyltransferase MnmC